MAYKIGFWNGIHRAQKWRDENPKASARLDEEEVERDNSRGGYADTASGSPT